MKTKIRNITIILILAIIILFSKTVKAESKVEMQLTSSDTKLIAGQSVEVTLSITNIDAGNGIDAIVGKINYDENVFEEITDEELDGQNKWNVQIYNPNTRLFTISKSSKVNKNSDVLKITFKVKEGVTAENAKISISDIVVSGGSVATGGTGDIKVSETSITIKANQDTEENKGDNNQQENPEDNEQQGNQEGNNQQGSQEGNNQQENQGNNNQQGNQEGNNQQVNQGNNNQQVNQGSNNQQGNNGATTNKVETKNIANNNDTTKSTKILPKTGITKYLFICIIIIIIAGIIGYLKYKKISKEIK